MVMKNTKQPRVNIALYYANRGWPVIPLHYPKGNQCSCLKQNCTSIGKHPITKHGLKEGTIDQMQIRRWWNQYPSANIGIITGGKSQLLVVDIDLRSNGILNFQQFTQGAHDFETLTSLTGGGGKHLYFEIPNNLNLSSKVNLIDGVDIRSDGGYVVAPGSKHVSGTYYRWDQEERPLSLIPKKLVQLINSTNQSNKTLPASHLYQNIFKEGNRNATLTRIAGFLHHLGLSRSQLQENLTQLNAINCTPPLDGPEVSKIANSIGKYDRIQWSAPRSLESIHKPLIPFPNHLIPEPISEWVMDCAARIGCPQEFTATSAILAAASAIGRQFGVHPRSFDDWLLIPNLWGAIVAPPGGMKTPGINAGFRLLREQENILRDKSKTARIITSDATCEKHLEIMSKNPFGITLLRDELSGWMELMERSGRQGERQFYLEAWNGDTPYTMDRIGRGTTSCDATCISIIGGIQPDKIGKIASFSEDGLIQRFQLLIVATQLRKKAIVDKSPNKEIEKKVANIFFNLCKGRLNTNKKPIGLRLCSKSVEDFIALEHRIDSMLPGVIEKDRAFASHITKLTTLVPKLSLVFELIKDQNSRSISYESYLLAKRWHTYFQENIKQFYEYFRVSDSETATKSMATKILNGQIRDKDSKRDIYRNGYKGLSTPLKVNNAVEGLTKLGWIKMERIKLSSGRHTEVIRINPQLEKLQ